MQGVFIGGVMRSGTTMLGADIEKKYNAVCIPESHFINEMYYIIASDEFVKNRREACRKILNLKYFKLFWEFTDREETLVYEKIEQTKTAEDVFDLLVRVYANRKGCDKFDFYVDHTPSNYTRYDLLKEIASDCRFIHIYRDPRAVVSSLKEVRFGPNTAYFGARLWNREFNEIISISNIYKDIVSMDVCYEEYLTEQPACMKRIEAFIGQNMMRQDAPGTGKQYSGPGLNVNVHKLVGKAPDRSRITAWKTKLTLKEVQIIEEYCGVYMKAIGYEIAEFDNVKTLDLPEKIAIILSESLIGAKNHVLQICTKRS